MTRTKTAAERTGWPWEPASYDGEWLDAQYNNRARIAEHPQIFERWARSSLAVRERYSRRLDVRYGQGECETLDLFPTTRANAPVLLFIHGGWWRSLDKSDHSFIAPAFVDQGVCVVAVNYGLAPGTSIERIALQMTQALAWTYREIERYGGNRKRIVLAGHSAGAHLATMLLGCDARLLGDDLPSHIATRALAISGVYELEPVRRTPFLKDDLNLTPRAVARLSPARWAPPRGARVFAVAGELESEEFLRHNELLCAAWGPRAIALCEKVAGANHLDVLDHLAAPDSRLHALAMQLLRD